MESYSVKAVLSAVDRNFTSTMKHAASTVESTSKTSETLGNSFDKTSVKADKMGTSILDVAKGIGAFKLVEYGVNLVRNSVDSAIKRVDTLNNATRTFENMGFGKGETSKAMKDLKASIQGLPTPLNEAVSNMQLLAASTNNLGKSQKIYAAMNNAIIGFGGSTEMVNNAMIQLSQAFSNGKIDAQTWNSMINSGMGPALNALARQMNVTTGELKSGLSEGTISVESFQDALIDLNRNGGGGLKSLETITKDSTSGIGTGISNMKTAVTRGMANIIESVNNALKNTNLKSISSMISELGIFIEGVLKKVAAYIPIVISFIGNLYKKIEPFLPLISGLISFISTYQTVMGLATAAVKMYTIAQGIMNAVMNANPIGLIVTSIILLVAGFIHLWKTSDKFRNFWIGLWESIKNIISDVGKWFKDAWNGTIEWFKNLWSGIGDFFFDLWKGIGDSASAGVKGVKDVWSSITGFFSDLWAGVKKSASDVWSSITTKLSAVFGKVTGALAPLISWFGTLWESIKSIAGSYWEIIKTVIMGPILLLIDLITGNFDQLKKDAIMLWNTLVDNIVNIFTTYINTVVGFLKAFVETFSGIWDSLVTKVTGIWNSFTTWLSNTTKAIVDGIVSWWNNLKQGTIDAYNATIQWVKDTWNNFKQWISDTTNAIIKGISDGWNNLKQWTIDAFNGLVDGAKKAWDTLVDSVKKAIDKVIEIFNVLKNIDLLEIGKAIIDGFIKGLKAAWEAGKKFISGIGDWIREHKGPIRKDKKLLTPAGNVIMDGLNKGLMAGFRTVKSNVSGMGDLIASTMNGDYSLDIGANVVAANQAISSELSHDINLNSGKQPGVFNIKLGNQVLKAFVDDISTIQGQEIDLNLQF